MLSGDFLHAGMENINWNLAVQHIEQRSHSKNSPRLSVIPRQSAFLPWKSPSTRCHSEPVTDITGVRISRMKGTTYRFAPKIPPVYEQSMGGLRSPALFNGEIPTPACAGSEWHRVGTALSVTAFCRDSSPKGGAKGASPRQIPVYLLNPLKTLYFQGISPILCSNLMCFPLFLPLRAETRESFLLSADHLIQQSCGSTLRFPCSVSVNIHCGTDIGVSEKLLHILRRCPV